MSRPTASPPLLIALAVCALAAWPLARSALDPSPPPSFVSGLLRTGAGAGAGTSGFPAVDAEAVERARALLREEPLAAEAYGVLGLAAAQAGDDAAAGRLLEISAAWARRDALVQARLLARDLARGEPRSAMARLDAVLRARPEAAEELASTLGPLLADPAARAALVERLAAAPPWRRTFLDVALRRWPEPAGLVALFAGLQAAPAGLPAEELRPYLAKLLAVGEVDEAYAAWLRSLPEGTRAALPYLYNGDFALPLTQAPFDWRTPPTPGARAAVAGAGGEPALSVGFLGSRVQGRPVMHELVLAPGDYRLTGRVRADRLVSRRGVRWRLACLAQPDGALGLSEAFAGTQGWRDFAMDFTVPEEGCPAQSLGLEIDARTAPETEASGVVSFSALAVDPR